MSIRRAFSALPKASELLGTIETLNNDLEPHMDEIKAQIEHLKAQREEAQSMNPALRTTIKVITALVFLALIALAVFGTDALTSWFKSLF